MEMPGQHVAVRTRYRLVREYEWRLDERSAMPAHELLPPACEIMAIVIPNHDIDSQAGMLLPPESERMQKGIARPGRAMHKIAQNDESRSGVRRNDPGEPL